MATTTAEKAREEMEAARAQVMDCEKEIQSIKTALRQLGSSGDESAAPNSLEVSALKVTGLPDSARPSFVLQLSSPVEELVLTKLFDASDADAEGSVAVFKQVEISVATLSVTAKDVDIPLGVSAPHDVAPLCKMDAMSPQKEYVSELDVAIVPDSGTSNELDETMERQDSFKDALDHEETGVDNEAGEKAKEKVAEGAAEIEGKKEETTTEESTVTAEEEVKTEESTLPHSEPKEEEKDPAEESKEDPSANEASSSMQTPICTVTFRITYKPSAKDQREELYDVLNKASQRKAHAIDRLRKSATAVSRAGPTTTVAAPESSSRSTPAVQAGFLNKKKSVAKPNKAMQLYEKTIGPDSLLRKIFPVAKNYIIFFGAAAFFHFKGQLLALPPPV